MNITFRTLRRCRLKKCRTYAFTLFITERANLFWKSQCHSKIEHCLKTVAEAKKNVPWKPCRKQNLSREDDRALKPAELNCLIAYTPSQHAPFFEAIPRILQQQNPKLFSETFCPYLNHLERSDGVTDKNLVNKF